MVTSDQESQLQSLLPEYPELKEVIRHRSEYPTEVIDVFLKNQEALEYLVDYPAEAGKGTPRRYSGGTERGRNSPVSPVGQALGLQEIRKRSDRLDRLRTHLSGDGVSRTDRKQ